MTLRPLCPELAEKARKELNEDPSRVQEYIEKLRDWLLKQPHIKGRTDDQFLIIFLRGCKYSMERAKQKLDLYYTCRTAIPEFRRLHYTDPLFFEILNSGFCIPLLKTWAPDAPLVAILRVGVCDLDKYNIWDFVAVAQTIQKIQMLEVDNALISGFHSIIDVEHSSIANILQISPTTWKKMIVICQDASPIRQKGFHYINAPSTSASVLNMVKSLSNEKNRSKFSVYNKDYEDLYKIIPKEIMPVEYGGNSGTIPEILEYWKKKVIEYGPWLDEESTFGVDESKRPGKPKTAEELFGVEGSFRQLEVD